MAIEIGTKQKRSKEDPTAGETGGLARWLLARFAHGERARPRLMLLERISLAPRQSLALVEAEGRRFLVATSTDGAPCFYPLEGSATSSGHANDRLENSHSVSRQASRPSHSARVSW